MDQTEENAQPVSELEQIALARKERLKNVRAQISATHDDSSAIDVEKPLFFRSYQPVGVDAPKAKKGEQLSALENVIQDQIENTFDTAVKESLDLNTLAPRKVDWDLRRGIQQKLDLLDRKTQKSIGQLIRKCLEFIESN